MKEEAAQELLGGGMGILKSSEKAKDKVPAPFRGSQISSWH